MRKVLSPRSDDESAQSSLTCQIECNKQLLDPLGQTESYKISHRSARFAEGFTPQRATLLILRIGIDG